MTIDRQTRQWRSGLDIIELHAVTWVDFDDEVLPTRAVFTRTDTGTVRSSVSIGDVNPDTRALPRMQPGTLTILERDATGTSSGPAASLGARQPTVE